MQKCPAIRIIIIYSSNTINFIELYISKAYTSELNKLNMIPIFNTFDKCMEYSANDNIEYYTLYSVSSTQTNIIWNKLYTLFYGSSLKHLNTTYFKLLRFKKPSFVVDWDYSPLVNNLWNTEISDQVELDKSIKKWLIMSWLVN